MFRFRKTQAVFCIFIIFIVSLFTYQYVLTTNLKKETVDKIGEITSQNVKVINHEIEDTFNLLNESKMQIFEHYYHDQKFDQEGIIHNFQAIVNRQAFVRMGIVLNDGTTFTTREKELEIFDRRYIQEALKGHRYISDVFIDRENQKRTVVLSMPLDFEGEILGTIFVGYNIEQFRNQLSVTSFQGDGYSYIIASNGDAIIDSAHKGAFDNFENLYFSLDKASSRNAFAIQQLKDELGIKEKGSFVFTNKIDKYCYFQKLGIKDWYLLTVVPKENIDQTSDFVLRMTVIFFLVLVVLFDWLMYLLFGFLRKQNKELEKILYVDKVTKKNSYEKFLKEAPVFFKRLMSQEKAAFIYLDIDNFKLINDIYGYEAGNRTICFVSDIIQKYLSHRDLCARVMAEQFTILMSYRNREELLQFVHHIHDDLHHEARVAEGYELKTKMGIYEIQNYDEELEFMQNCAKIAHASIKGKHDVDLAFYNDEMRATILYNKTLENSIAQALEQDEFVVYYQPKYDTFTQCIVGSEALIRWNSPKNGILSPAYFIEVAESTGQIIQLDECVFRKVCMCIRSLLDQHQKVVPVSVNVSKKTLYQPKFIEKYKQILDFYEVPASMIQLEITESLLYIDSNRTNKMIRELNEIGFKILMDDFGTGYSSLMMLKDIEVDILKLDKSFVDGYLDPKGQEILVATLNLAHALKMNTVAEGVETQDQFEYLKALHCEVIQGYYFSKPLSEEVYVQLLKN